MLLQSLQEVVHGSVLSIHWWWFFFLSLTIGFMLGFCNRHHGHVFSLSLITILFLSPPPTLPISLHQGDQNQLYSTFTSFGGREKLRPLIPSFLPSSRLTECLLCTSIVVRADDIGMDKTDKISVVMEQMACHHSHHRLPRAQYLHIGSRSHPRPYSLPWALTHQPRKAS